MRAVRLLLIIAGLAIAGAPQAHAGNSFNNVVSLGDSLLDDTTGDRSPLVSEHLAARIGAPLTKLAVSGSTSATLIAGGQHTTAAANFGPGDLAILWIGGNDFFANASAIAIGNLSFLNNLENNVDLVLSTLVGAGLDVLVLNQPDFAVVPAVLVITPAAFLPQFTAASLAWRTRLDILAATYGVPVVDIFSYSQQISADPGAFSLIGNNPIPGPSFGDVGACQYCLFHDGIHPSALGQGYVTNDAINDYNAFFGPAGAAALAPLDESELLALVMDIGTWSDVAGGTPGVQGVPTLEGSGALVANSTLSIELTNGHPGALALLWLSTASTPLSKFGGTIHAFPVTSQYLVSTDAAGGFSDSTRFPMGLAPGTELWFQFLCQDPDAVQGVTLSDAMKATTP
jgi:lysophospholipase L1-like esterase